MEKTKLPDYIIILREVENQLEGLQTMEDAANDGLNVLKSEGIPANLATLEEILKDDEAFKKWLDKAEESYVGRMGFVPNEEKKRIHSTFQDLFRRTDSARCAVGGLIFNQNGYKVLQDKQGKLYFDKEPVRKHLEEKSKRKFSEKDKEYFSIIQDAFLAFQAVKQFEQRERYAPFSQTETFLTWMKCGLSVEGFARSWEWGKMSNSTFQMMEGD